MDFYDVKSKAIQCLNEGKNFAENRLVGDKNLLKLGLISIVEVIQLIEATKMNQHSISKHHLDKSVEVHILKPVVLNVKWYIKLYFIDSDCWFISVHKAEK